MLRRIGVMGGMFDPVHLAHLAVAKQVLNTLALDVVHLVPCAVPNHRGQPGATGEHRVHMLSLAVADESRLVVDQRELQRAGVSYMVDTLNSFATEFPDATLVYILGLDSFHSLPAWHRWRDLIDICHLCVTGRPGVTREMPDELALEVARRQVDSVAALFKQPRGSVLYMEDLDLPISSSAIRQALARGEMPAQLPQSVQTYIREHRLYF
ncbi:nicotinate-nucleotide adenylyltransferase [Gammaproteobacteria bacterium LSUCC0112]|nr:nicotinate-nucleotide adenylyltransferase [Gammaproteobacteria bacterium LSUCC0112]